MTFSIRAIDFLILPIFIKTRANNYGVTYLLFFSQAPLTSDFGSTNIMGIFFLLGKKIKLL